MDNQNIDESNHEIDRILDISLAERKDSNSENQRYCWVCFANDEENVEGLEWIKPCRCKGTLMWVHQSCLQRWVDEKQRGNSFKRVQCVQCQTEYIIISPGIGLVADVLEGIDNIIRRSSPFIAAGIFVGSFYWTACTYGAITVLQLLGKEIQ